jgi:hypothetical protein
MGAMTTQNDRKQCLRDAIAVSTEAVDYFGGRSDRLPALAAAVAAEAITVSAVAELCRAFGSLVVSALEVAGVDDPDQKRLLLQQLAHEVEIA